MNLLSLLQELDGAEPMAAVLGVADDGAPLLLRLTADDVGNVLITGAEGAGKAALLRTLVLSLALATDPPRLRIAVIDPTARALPSLAGLPHLIAPPADRPASLDDMIRRLLETLESRWRAENATPRIVVAVNAPAELSRTVGPLIAGDLIRLAQDGNPVGMHLLLCEANPHKLPEELLMHFPVRLVGRVVDREAARLASGRDDSGAETLPGEGHFVAITPDETIRFRAAGCRLPEVQRAVRSLSARAASPKRAFAWKAMGV